MYPFGVPSPGLRIQEGQCAEQTEQSGHQTINVDEEDAAKRRDGPTDKPDLDGMGCSIQCGLWNAWTHPLLTRKGTFQLHHGCCVGSLGVDRTASFPEGPLDQRLQLIFYDA